MVVGFSRLMHIEVRCLCYEKCGFKLLSSADEQELTRSMYFDLKCFE